MTTGTMILIAAVATFLGLGAFVLYRSFRWAFPDGKRVTGGHNGFKCTLIYRDHLLCPEAVAQAGARAAWATAVAMHDAALGQYAMKRLRHTVIWLQNDGLYRSPTGKLNSAAYLDKVGRIVGSRFLPMAVIRLRYESNIQDKGEPAIHESIHQILDDIEGDPNREHDEPEFWIEAGGDDSIQAKAEWLFKAPG